ncbi:MAG: TonB family protein [Sphingobacteriales bacterium]|nr:MAG: TonB family protein [Sphingobacteriales bacterium]
MKRLNLLLLLLAALPVAAQKIEQTLDARFKPTQKEPRYYSILTSTGNRWHRDLYYLPERTQAMSGDFLDSMATQPEGEHLWYGTSRHLERVEHYAAGKKHGAFLTYTEKDELMDSAQYENGWRKGLGLRWSPEGYVVDSSWFDGNGNGRVVSRYSSGALAVTGRYVRDTARDGRWIYYHDNGRVQAEVDFSDNKATACQSYTPEGAPGDPTLCIEREAEFPGGQRAWAGYLMKTLEAPAKAKPGIYTVRYRFVVNKDGSLSNFEVLSSPGRIFDQEVLRLLKASPKWAPAVQFGRYVKAYRTQPVSFMISE